MKRIFLGCLVLLLGFLASCAPGAEEPETGAPEQVEASVWINELHYDNDGDDVGEAVELAGVAGTDLTGWRLELYNGSDGTVYDTTNLAGTISNQQNGFGTVAVEYPQNGLQNGSPDALALVDVDENVVQFLSYEGTFEGTDGAAVGLTSTDIGVAEGSGTAAGTSLQLTGTGESAADFSWTDSAEASFGQVNAGQIFGEGGGDGGAVGQCGDPATPIHAIQGTGETFDPAFGGTQTVEGVVTASFEGLSGFYIQEEAEDVDASAGTSEGIFVFVDAAPDVMVGDVVRVTGTVAEFENSGTSQTQLAEPTDVVSCGAGVLPEAVALTLPFESVGGLEAFEGMLVTFPQALTIAEYFNYDRFGETVLALPLPDQVLPFQPTAVEEPGSAEAAALADYLESARITLDDGRASQNPASPRHPNGELFTLENTFRGGDTVANATGVLDHSFGRYRLQPTTGADYTPLNPRSETPDEVGGSLKVASFNVLNLFNGDGAGGGYPTPRGADDEDEYLRQQAKIVAALRLIDADIVGLVEIENDAAGEAGALDDLVEALNAVGGDAYAYIDTGEIGTDEIRVALVYKPDAVTPVGDFAILDSTVDERFIDTKNRPVLAQTFEDAAGARLTVAVNHLKSKGSECGAGDDDPEQGNCNLTRTQAAEAMVDWLAADPTASGDPDVLIIGDLNAYDKEDPIDALLQGSDDTPETTDDYTDLSFAFEGERTYSYVFDGQFGYLDYALSSATLTPQVTGATTWHINSPEPDLLDYDTSFNPPEFYAPTPYRSSDHDPVVVGVALQ